MKLHNKVSSISNSFIDLISSSFKKVSDFIFDVERTHSHNYLLALASVLLTFASAYTTFYGFREYIDNVYVVLLITFGVQSLLLISSWQLGAHFASKDIPVSLWLTFFFSISISVYFSYTNLYGTIYVNKYQEHDTFVDSKNSIIKIKKKIELELINEEDDLIDKVNDEIKLLTANLYEVSVKAINALQDEISVVNSKIEKAEKYNSIEIHKGGTTKNSSLPGNGEIAKSYLKEKVDIETSELRPLEARLINHTEEKGRFDQGVSDLLVAMNKNKEGVKFGGIIVAISKSCNYFEVITVDKKFCERIFGVEKYINRIMKIRNYLNTPVEKYDAADSSEAIFNYLQNVIYDSPLSEYSSTILVEYLSGLITYGGKKEHVFESSFRALINFQSLAVASFLLALAIDMLIFICGLLGAKQASYLDIHKSEDLRLLKERALESILSMDLSPRYGDTIMVDNIKKILRLSNFSPEGLRAGYAASIEFDTIRENKLEREIGLLFSLKLVTNTNNEDRKIFLHIAFFLWMADKLKKADGANEISNSLRKILEELKINRSENAKDDKYKRFKNAVDEIDSVINLYNA